MAYEELLEWTRNRPLWQQDALRRLALYGELKDDDLASLRLQIEKTTGLPAENAPGATPIAAEHLHHAAGNDPRTVLASLGPVQHVDRLSSDQPPLRFAVNGVTLIYGANGSGKSGYCRIAKQLCRSRGSAELRGNVYEGGVQNVPVVEVSFRVGGDDEPKDDRIWYGNQKPPIELSRISVFDTAAAHVYVDKRRKIEFLPYELDLLNKLGLACKALDRCFEERLNFINEAVSDRPPSGYCEGTNIQGEVAKLVPQTVLTDLPSERHLHMLASWTTEKEAELNDVEKQLTLDPKEMIRIRSEAKGALEMVSEEILAIENDLVDSALASIRREQQKAEATSHAAEAAAKGLFTDLPISDLGSETWRHMLRYAREFASTAFPNAPSPQLNGGGLCVLCQQELDENAAKRMEAFDAYIVGRASEESAAAAQVLAQRRTKLMALRVRCRTEVESLLAGYAALSDACKESATTLATFVEKAGERLEAVNGALGDDQSGSLDDLDPLPASPAQLIDDEIGRLEAEIIALGNAKHDEEAQAQLQARRADLVDRKRLNENIEAIVERRNRLANRRQLEACRKQCVLTAITRRITDRRREILTPTLRENLDRELKGLGLAHIPLDLSDRGREAESIIEISLSAQQRIANNSDVLSEGEQRALALACFLAELQESGGDHSIIVDDPVSSLDYNRMQAVAERLAEEASGGRQVIVFTHNVLFHYMLRTEVRRVGVALQSEWMSNSGNVQFGLIDETQKPWQIKGVSERLSEIEKGFFSLTSNNGYDHNDQEFRPEVIDLYTKMRETWERVIEEVLFNNSVQRFRPEIMTQRLKAAYFDPEADYPDIFEGMARCSRYSGHDPAPELPQNLPNTIQIERDIEHLKNFKNRVMSRRRTLNKDKQNEDGIKPVLL